MTVAAAQAAAQQLRVALLDNGVRQVSLELQPGVGPKSDPWGVAPFVRGLGHHIVSTPTQGNNPGLALVKRGRTGKNALQGPLCNGYGGFDRIARIITMGWANHPGEGGPWTVPGWGTVPRNDGRPRIFGWEFEGGVVPWTDEMHEFMAQCGAGTLDWLGWLNSREAAPLECWGEHGHPWAEGRKIDRLNYTATSGRERIAAVRGRNTTTIPTALEEDVPLVIKPGKSLCLPTTTESSDLAIGLDNPDRETHDFEDGNGPILIEGCTLRIAVQHIDGTWHPVNRPDTGFPPDPREPFVTNLGLGGWAVGLAKTHGHVRAVTVSNKGFIPVQVTLSPHPA